MSRQRASLFHPRTCVLTPFCGFTVYTIKGAEVAVAQETHCQLSLQGVQFPSAMKHSAERLLACPSFLYAERRDGDSLTVSCMANFLLIQVPSPWRSLPRILGKALASPDDLLLLSCCNTCVNPVVICAHLPVNPRPSVHALKINNTFCTTTENPCKRKSLPWVPYSDAMKPSVLGLVWCCWSWESSLYRKVPFSGGSGFASSPLPVVVRVRHFQSPVLSQSGRVVLGQGMDAYHLKHILEEWEGGLITTLCKQSIKRKQRPYAVSADRAKCCGCPIQDTVSLLHVVQASLSDFLAFPPHR